MLPDNIPEDHINYLRYYKEMDERNKINQAPEKREFTKNEKLIALLSSIAILLVVGGYAANKIIHKNYPVATEIPASPTETPQITVETTPVAIETPIDNNVEVLPTVESLEVSASLISNPEQLAKTFENNRSTAWLNAGATPENAKTWGDSKSGAQSIEFIDKIASEYDKIFIEALYIKEWQSNPKLVASVERMKSIHKNTLKLYFMTYPSDMYPQDKEAYKRGIEVTKVYPNNPVIIDGVKHINIITVQHDYDNSQLNRIGLENHEGVSGEDNQPSKSYIVEDGKLKIWQVTY